MTDVYLVYHYTKKHSTRIHVCSLENRKRLMLCGLDLDHNRCHASLYPLSFARQATAAQGRLSNPVCKTCAKRLVKLLDPVTRLGMIAE